MQDGSWQRRKRIKSTSALSTRSRLHHQLLIVNLSWKVGSKKLSSFKAGWSVWDDLYPTPNRYTPRGYNSFSFWCPEKGEGSGLAMFLVRNTTLFLLYYWHMLWEGTLEPPTLAADGWAAGHVCIRPGADRRLRHLQSPATPGTVGAQESDESETGHSSSFCPKAQRRDEWAARVQRLPFSQKMNPLHSLNSGTVTHVLFICNPYMMQLSESHFIFLFFNLSISVFDRFISYQSMDWCKLSYYG